MKNKDRLIEQKRAFAENFQKAIKDQNVEAVMKAFDDYSQNVQAQLLDTAKEFAMSNDKAVLAARGIRQLTSEEEKFYTNLAEAMQAADPKQALKDGNLTIPITALDTILEDIVREHPMLEAVDFQNTTGAVRWLYTDGSKPLATWGALTSEITAEITQTFKTLDMMSAKLSAFIPVSKDILKLGPAYLDSYIRQLLSEAIAAGFETGIVKGTGNGQPIGMIKDLDGAVTQGSYSDKTKTKLTSLDVISYCAAVGKLAVRSDGSYRTLSSVDFFCNPKDYIEKVVPATTVLGTDGTYKNNIFPFPTTVYTTEALAEGEAVLGVPKKYICGLSGSKDGEIDYSDSAQFLEDNRVYTARLYANGKAKDNNAFLYLDISELEALKLTVKVEQDAQEVAGSSD